MITAVCFTLRYLGAVNLTFDKLGFYTFVQDDRTLTMVNSTVDISQGPPPS